MKTKFIYFISISLLFSCNNQTENKSPETEYAKENKVSTDIKKLEKIIDLNQYRPEKVRFLYLFQDNSKGRIPGPSDYVLEAEIYYNTETMKKIREIDIIADIQTPSVDKINFMFNWLSKETKNELTNSDTSNLHPDFLFGTENGTCWYLKDKILLIKHSN